MNHSSYSFPIDVTYFSTGISNTPFRLQIRSASWYQEFDLGKIRLCQLTSIVTHLLALMLVFESLG
jgi:hypothetical protein